MAKMQSDKASQVKISGELAKRKLATKLNASNPKHMFINEESHKEICDSISAFGKVMLRTGKNWQFHLGEIPEISDSSIFSKSLEKIKIEKKTIFKGTHSIGWERQLTILKDKLFWDKYFAKGNDILCYSNNNNEYFFFNIKEIISFIIANTEWRLLESGRIKGDVSIGNSEYKTIFTIEFRNEIHKKCFAFGAHGGNKGIDLFLILLRNVKHYHCNL